MVQTTYLITGANRGLGQALLAVYLARPETTVIAGVRDPNHATAKALAALSKGNSMYPTVATVKPEEIQEHVSVNVIGPVLLFQAVLPLLEKSANQKFVVLSSSAASIGAIEYRPVPNAAYGSSKTMLNYIFRKAHFEHENLTVFSIDPGWVQTEMGNRAAVIFGVGDSAEISVKQSVDGLTTVIDGATREKTSGHFLVYDGSESLW